MTRHWARLVCVSTRFSSLISNICCKLKCSQTIPSVVYDLLSTAATSSSAAAPPGGWASMYKLAVCCPGLLLSGVLLENSDFGLERELGPEEEFNRQMNVNNPNSGRVENVGANESNVIAADCCWSLYDDLMFDTMYGESESGEEAMILGEAVNGGVVKAESDLKKKICKSLKSHLASGVWNLSREQGNKLLASRFKGDCLYICDWPGCIHMEEKRNYMLFRGIFRNFKQSRVWRTINDGKRKMIDLNCAFCAAKQTWDLHSAFCLRSHFGFHDDGEPVVRAYVCENGHVSGAWTDWPLYT
ncbi:hypothetical protein Leryth_011184 [Lithospermum erythrorhizon]|nr:hypothetical protein Leryth_011184 [Lithospermum erythrorhizon]